MNVTVTQASHAAFGAGCAGTAGTPSLAAEAGSLPWIGETFRVEVTNLPAASALILLVGESRTAWGSFSLPFDLSPLGMSGCALLVSGAAFLHVPTGSGSATVPLPICNCPVLVGGSFFSQALVFDPGANPAGATASNGGEGRFGAR